MYVCKHNQNDIDIYRIPELDELSEEENQILKEEILKNYDEDEEVIKAEVLYDDEDKEKRNLSDLIVDLFESEILTEKEYENISDDNQGSSNNVDFIKTKISISDQAEYSLKHNEEVYYVKSDEEVYSINEMLEMTDLDNYLSEVHDVPFEFIKINDKFIYQEFNCEFAEMDYNVITKEKIKLHLVNQGSISFMNSHDEMFGGSHKIWWDEEEEAWKCFGSGTNWRDQSDDYSIQEIDKIVESVMKHSKVYIF